MAVSPATETKLRAAMQRLLDGAPLRTDGALTKENLAREAEVSHATVHRAHEILTEWDARVGRPVLRPPARSAETRGSSSSRQRCAPRNRRSPNCTEISTPSPV